MRTAKVPGVSVTVARGEQVLIQKAYGLSDVENNVTATNETVFRIGSITKQFTAATILRLVEQERLALDDDIVKYVPHFHGNRAPVTIRQLLNLTSGVQGFTEVPAFAALKRIDLSDSAVLDVFQDTPANFAPGTNFVYNNSGFYLLGMVIERVTGQTYDRYMRDFLLAPLGLLSTDACSDARIDPHRARGYALTNAQVANAPFISLNAPKGGGNLYSTAADLVTWARALAGGRVISRESYALMTTPGTLADGRSIGYGLGLFLSTLEGREEIFHGGGIPGFTAFIACYPALEEPPPPRSDHLIAACGRLVIPAAPWFSAFLDASCARVQRCCH